MRVVLADDQEKVRSALMLLLAQEPHFQIVGEAADATGLLRAVSDKAPDLLLLDWELPGLPARQLLSLLRFEQPMLRVVAMSSRPEARRKALDAGAQAFVSKNEPPERLRALMRAQSEEIRS